jgi:hypothetical protein
VLQAEARGQHTLNDAVLAILDAIVVAADDFDKQHGKGESGVVSSAGSMGIVDPG